MDANDEALVLDKAAFEMAELRPGTTDCGVVLTTTTAAITPDPPESTLKGWLPASRTLQWPSLVTNVNMATNACHGYYDCLGVVVFVTSPMTTHPVSGADMYVVRYMDRNAGLRAEPRLVDTEGTEASGGFWTATHIWERRTGYACPSDHVDATWYYNTWQSRLSDVLPEAIPLDVPSAVEHFKTIGHLWRLWPNEHCKLTPVLLTAESGCTVLRCPTHTVCPAGYRIQDVESNWCSLGAGPEQTQLETGASTLYTNSYLASNGGAYVTPPCNYNAGSDTTGGECGYDLTVMSSDNPQAVCHCNPDVPLDDASCQFVASAHCRGYRPSTATNCNGEGVCRLDMGAIDWEEPDLGMTPLLQQMEYDAEDPPPIQCHCDSPDAVLAPWCDRSVCSFTTLLGQEVDCHTDPVDEGSPTPRSGTCQRAGDTFKCVCNDFYFGEQCEHHDYFDPIADSPTEDHACFSEAADVGLSIPGKLFSECSGHGVCTVHDIPVNNATMTCECAGAYSGVWCQYSDCPDCGPFGKCVTYDPDTSPTGEYETACVCAVHQDSFSTPVAGKPIGAALDGPCVVDLCLDVAQGRYGSLVLDPDTLRTGGSAPPRGTCVCTIAGNGLRNEGILCDEPVCERDAEGNECGIPLVAVKNKVCKACADHAGLLECAGSVLPLGAVCDCDNAEAETTPYWLSEQSIDRYTHDGDRGVTAQPVCSIYCHHGTWREEAGTHSCQDCFTEGFVGERCDDAICVHGHYDPGISSLCVPGSCEPGWAGARCNKCDPAFGLDNTLGDANPGCDVCLAGWSKPLGLSPTEVAALPQNATCAPCNAVAYCHAAGTATQTCAHDHAPTKYSCGCELGWTGTTCAVCAEGYARAEAPDDPCQPVSSLLSCGQGAVGDPASAAVVILTLDGVLDSGESHCRCRPNFDVATACATCLAGFSVSPRSGECVPCAEALECGAQGTESVACPVPGSLPHGKCECFPAYAGATCSVCAVGEGAVWDADAQACVKCDLGCGVNGVPNCDADPPVCMCYNGYGGTHCDVCTGCGPGGDCVSGAFLLHPWCVCRNADGWGKSITAETPGATATDIRLAPCDACGAGSMPHDGVCKPVLDVCGFGAHVLASKTQAACFCGPLFLPLSQQPSGRCEVCAQGGVGPDCESCDPACTTHAHCVWQNTTLRVGPDCECDPGFVDSLLGPCSQCDTPTFQGTFCRPCPESCGIGACTVEPLSQDTYCLCPGGSRHAVATDPSSPCTMCAPGETPLSCRPCPVCGANALCMEDARGDPTCPCMAGYTRAPGATRFADPCFREDDLRTFRTNPVLLDFLAPREPMPATDLATQLDALATGKRVLIYAALPLFTASMCCCGCLVWFMRTRMLRRRAAARTAKARAQK